MVIDQVRKFAYTGGEEAENDINTSSAMRVPFAVFLMTLSTGSVFAQQTMIKDGDCPSGYFERANKCVPTDNARPAYTRNGGECPNWYKKSGAYCLADAKAQNVIPHTMAHSNWTRFKHEWLFFIFGTQ